MPTRGWEGRLRLAAKAIDERLKADPMQSVVHGDPKDANFYFAADGTPQLYDFQYCGKACPAKDVAYCLCCGSSAWDDADAWRAATIGICPPRWQRAAKSRHPSTRSSRRWNWPTRTSAAG